MFLQAKRRRSSIKRKKKRKLWDGKPVFLTFEGLWLTSPDVSRSFILKDPLHHVDWRCRVTRSTEWKNTTWTKQPHHHPLLERLLTQGVGLLWPTFIHDDLSILYDMMQDKQESNYLLGQTLSMPKSQVMPTGMADPGALHHRTVFSQVLFKTWLLFLRQHNNSVSFAQSFKSFTSFKGIFRIQNKVPLLFFSSQDAHLSFKQKRDPHFEFDTTNIGILSWIVAVIQEKQTAFFADLIQFSCLSHQINFHWKERREINMNNKESLFFLFLKGYPHFRCFY